MGLYNLWLLHGGSLLLGLAQALQEGLLLAAQTAVQPPPLAGAVQLHQLLAEHKNTSSGERNANTQIIITSVWNINSCSDDVHRFHRSDNASFGTCSGYNCFHSLLQLHEDNIEHHLLAHLLGHVQKLVQVHTPVGELPEGTLLLDLGIRLGEMQHPKSA